ncbi:MAG: Maf family protein, partial [Acidobacteriaceae bacterium]|nr:Maf family protein [Acidobacteriaceae bacterium]
RPNEAADVYVARLAAEKSARCLALGEASDAVAIGADTSVVVDGVILGKPRDLRDAEEMLRRLAGRTHEVMTGISVRYESIAEQAVETTAVTFATLSDAQIAWYVASGEGLDKAGAYAIQGLASRFIPAIHGSYSNVVGLPIATVERLISRVCRAVERLAQHR